MATKIGIINQALSHLAISKEISNLDTDRSEEAATARRFYDTALEDTLRDFKWPFATRIAALALVETDPNDEWDYSYRYPTDCLRVRRILSGIRNDTRQSRVPYKVASDSQGILIFTDQEDAEIEYTVRFEDPQFYPSDFAMAFSYCLAYLMAPRITGGDQFRLGDRAFKLYQYQLSKAESNALNEEQAEEEPESQFVRDRE